MNLEEYQKEMERTGDFGEEIKLTQNEKMILWFSIGLAGETGELANKIKKLIFVKKKVHPDEIVGELGDVLWYVGVIAKKFGFTLEEIMQFNVAKLRKRYPDGYSNKVNRERKE